MASMHYWGLGDGVNVKVCFCCCFFLGKHIGQGFGNWKYRGGEGGGGGFE